MYPDRGPLASENSNQMIRFNLFRFLSGKKGQFHLSRKSYRKFHSNGKRSGFFRIEGFASKRSLLSPPPPASLVLFALAPFSASPECENSFSRPDTSFGSYGNACYAGKNSFNIFNVFKDRYKSVLNTEQYRTKLVYAFGFQPIHAMRFRTKFLLFVSICVPPNNPITACGVTSFPGYHSFPKWAIYSLCVSCQTRDNLQCRRPMRSKLQANAAEFVGVLSRLNSEQHLSTW